MILSLLTLTLPQSAVACATPPINALNKVLADTTMKAKSLPLGNHSKKNNGTDLVLPTKCLQLRPALPLSHGKRPLDAEMNHEAPRNDTTL